jgi:pyruvate dehydrogenase E2 component (dihydrolipoamide acetyltransferase)
MAHEFRFPDVGEGISEGEIVGWRVKVGDRVEAHQALLEVETDKAVVEIPSPVAGVVLELRGGPGDVIHVGDVLVVIGEPSERPTEPKTEPKGAEPKETPQAGRARERAEPEDIPVPGGRRRLEPVMRTKVRRGSVGVVGELEEAPDEEEEPAAPQGPAGRTAPLSAPSIQALPRDRRLARELGVDLSAVHGTGPGGRITEADVRKAAERGAPEKGVAERPGRAGEDAFGPVEKVSVHGVRRKIAEAMVRSLGRAAQVTTTDEANVTLLDHIRRKEKEEAARQEVKLTYLPFLMKAIVGALKREPFLNASLDDEGSEIIVKGYYNLGLAVETRDGLIVPNVKAVDCKSIIDLAREIEDLSMRARKRTLTVAELKGGTFTISNFGSIGGLFATPILNYPEVGILGVGKIQERPVAIAGAIKLQKILPLSLTFDHRVVDGATAQHFLNGIIRRLEDPDLILIGG